MYYSGLCGNGDSTFAAEGPAVGQVFPPNVSFHIPVTFADPGASSPAGEVVMLPEEKLAILSTGSSIAEPSVVVPKQDSTAKPGVSWSQGFAQATQGAGAILQQLTASQIALMRAKQAGKVPGVQTQYVRVTRTPATPKTKWPWIALGVVGVGVVLVLVFTRKGK